jgi:uncharacterized membrane protein YphA (DoxX/SURF4 family)
MVRSDSATETAARGIIAMALEELGSLIIRVMIGLLFLISAYVCSKDAGARQAAIADTALVFPWRTEMFTLAGILLMTVGGLSVLLGIFPRLGALALTLFLIPAAMIHFSKARQAAALKDAILAEAVGKSSGLRHNVTALGESAVIGNFTSALKNLNLMALTLYVALAGAEPMLIGFGPDGQLQGLLTRF